MTAKRQQASDRHRPSYHFTAPRDWLNDPNGLIQHHGTYHLFYQHADDPSWEVKQWGHAASDDLIRWRDMPVALAPSPGSPDELGCWSGVAVKDGDSVRLVYSGHDGSRYQHPCLATSTDRDLATFSKHPGNPIVPSPPPGIDPLVFRDHSVWREGDEWRMLIGSGLKGVGGTALLYRSTDLRNWEYRHPVAVGDSQASDPVWTGTVWECPDLFALDDGHVLLLAAMDEDAVEENAFMGYAHHAVYLSGRYAEERFTPSTGGRLDFGDFYAPQTFLSDDGRRLMFGWLWEARDLASQRSAGWSGAMSLPRVLNLSAGGKLVQAPAREVEGLRGPEVPVDPFAMPADSERFVDEIGGEALEIQVEIDPADARSLELNVLASPHGEERTAISFEASGRLVIDRSRSSLDPAAYRHPLAAQLALHNGEALRLRVFVDHSIVEVFANDRLCLTARVYPTRDDSTRVSVKSDGGQARVTRLRAWEMSSIWPEGRREASP